jgi:eukaryotic-like serine/threonine-protein kinase
MPIGDILRIAKETADGLAAAHERGVIHRDVKPSNIWLEGERRRVKIVDFGLAHERYSDVRLTQTGKVIGTPGYMSPEQVENKSIDQRSDLFSLGCVLYLLATGRDAFHGETAFDTIRAVVQDEPAPINPSGKMPAEFIALVMRLLAKKPSDRPTNASEVSKQLQTIREGRRQASIAASRSRSAAARSAGQVAKPGGDPYCRRLHRRPGCGQRLADDRVEEAGVFPRRQHFRRET